MVVSEQSISVVGANQEWPVLYRCLSATSCHFFLFKTDCATPFSAAGAVFLPQSIDWTLHTADQSVMLLRLLIFSLDLNSILLVPVHPQELTGVGSLPSLLLGVSPVCVQWKDVSSRLNFCVICLGLNERCLARPSPSPTSDFQNS